MGRRKYEPTVLERARDELFSHIQRCGVLEAEDGQRDEWLGDTIDYLAERYPDLDASDLEQLKVMGQRYCSPAIPHGDRDARDVQEEESAEVEVEPAEVDVEPAETGTERSEVGAA